MSGDLREALRKLVYRIRQRSTNKLHNREFAMTLDDCVRELAALSAQPQPQPEAVEADWRDDPTSDDRWQAGLDFAMIQFCAVLGVDPHDVTWDAATEEVEGDVRAVIGNILRAKLGEDWSSRTAPPLASDGERMRRALEPFANLVPSAFDHSYPDDAEIVLMCNSEPHAYLKNIDFRNAKAAYEALSRADEGKESEGGVKQSPASNPDYNGVKSPALVTAHGLSGQSCPLNSVAPSPSDHAPAEQRGFSTVEVDSGGWFNWPRGADDGKESAPVAEASHNSGERDSSVMPGFAGADPTPAEQREAIAASLEKVAHMMRSAHRNNLMMRILDTDFKAVEDAILALSTRAGG